MAEREKLIELKDLQITFGSGKKKFVAVDHVNFDIYKGETFSLVGESGSGKTTIGRAICRINPTSGGDIFFKGQKINGKISKELDREVIRKVQMIFQDPMASLNERAKVEYIVAEGLLNHHLYKDQNDLHEKVMNALHEVGLLPEFASRFPHEFSGGQRQRIGIARALVMEPEFIVADEPISALDVSIRAQVLNLLNSMKKSRGLTYLFIAHDLSVVRFISDRIAVISKGRIVELAEAEELFLHPLHPYTKALLSAVPIPDPGLEKQKKLLVYDPSCHDYSVDKPVWEEIANGHFVYGNQKELEAYRKEYESQLYAVEPLLACILTQRPRRIGKHPSAAGFCAFIGTSTSHRSIPLRGHVAELPCQGSLMDVISVLFPVWAGKPARSFSGRPAPVSGCAGAAGQALPNRRPWRTGTRLQHPTQPAGAAPAANGLCGAFCGGFLVW